MELEPIVIFRAWKKKKPNNNVIALFPNLIGNGQFCMSYEHVGQHGEANYNQVRSKTRPATPEEYADLKEELENIGYNLRVMKRRPKCNL